MMKSLFSEAILNVDEQGLFISVDLERTNSALNELLDSIKNEGGRVVSITPVMSGAGQYQFGEIESKKRWFSELTKSRLPGQPYSYGFGYSYTSGFIIVIE